MMACVIRQIEVLLADLIQLVLVHFLKVEHFISRRTVRPYDLVELDLQSFRVAILGVLYEENHEKRYDRGPGVDHELPRIAKAEERSGSRPYDYNRDSDHKRDRP